MIVAEGDIVSFLDSDTNDWSRPMLILYSAKWACLAWPLVHDPDSDLYHVEYESECLWVYICDSSMWLAHCHTQQYVQKHGAGFRLECGGVPIMKYALERTVNKFTFQDLLYLLEHFNLRHSQKPLSKLSRQDALELLCLKFGDQDFLSLVLANDSLTQKKVGKDQASSFTPEDEIALLLMEHFDQDEVGALKEEKREAEKKVRGAKHKKWRNLLQQKVQEDKESTLVFSTSYIFEPV